jgi:hypothetical protein
MGLTSFAIPPELKADLANTSANMEILVRLLNQQVELSKVQLRLDAKAHSTSAHKFVEAQIARIEAIE